MTMLASAVTNTRLTGADDLLDRVVLINGISSDIGMALADVLLLNGVRLAGTYCAHSGADRLVEEYGPERVRLYGCDLMADNYYTDVKSIVGGVAATYGTVDIVINAAGVIETCPFLYESEHLRRRVWRVNYEGAVAFAEHALRVMLGHGYGQIVNISSITGTRGAGQLVAYSASKAALISLTNSLAEEFGPRNIRANCISPAPVATKAIDRYYDDVAKELLAKNTPLGRLCSSEDVANAVLAVLVNKYMSGANVILHGAKLF